MDPITLAALLAAGGTLVSSGVNSAVNANLNKKNREWQEQMYTKYYSPDAQMSQMLSAGINPNLAAQGISGSPGISMPQASNSNNPVNVDFAGAIDAYTSLKLAEAEKKNIDADTENKDADTEGKKIKNKYLDEYWQNNVDKLKAEIDKLGVDTDVAQQMLDNLKQQFDQNEELFPLKKDKLQEEANEIRKNIQKMDKEMDVMDKQMDVMESEEAKNYAQARKDNVSAAVDEFVLEHGYKPDDPQTQVLRGLVSDDPEEKKAAEDFINVYNDFVSGFEESKRKGQEEGTPQGRERLRLEEERDQQISDIDDKMDRLRKEYDRPSTSKARKVIIKGELDYWKRKKTAVYDLYKGKIRRVSKGASVSIAGTGTSG